MEYARVVPATFLRRPNRFIAEAEVEGKAVVAHVKNTGRCRELLVPGAKIYLEDFGENRPGRKTRYDLIAVWKGDLLINMDAQAPNRVFYEWVKDDGRAWRPEVKWGDSRFDFYWQDGDAEGFVEVKGVTLEEDGAAVFPDAPTERGLKHVKELIRAKGLGYSAAICFVVQMERARYFAPNDRTHPAFGQALRAASEAGVDISARLCRVTPDSLSLGAEIPVVLSPRRGRSSM